MTSSQMLSRAVDRYTRETVESLTLPTRQEAESLRLEVLRCALAHVVDEQLRAVEDDRRRLAAQERTLSKIRSALMLAAPLMDVEGGGADDRTEGGAAP